MYAAKGTQAYAQICVERRNERQPTAVGHHAI